jgi:hypothetical protein
MTLQEEVTEKLLAGTATKQDIFGAVYDWFIVQKKPKSGGASAMSCFYRLDDGRKCAFGIFIPDSRYNSGFYLTVRCLKETKQ